MKGMDLFCASQASTAICVSIDQKTMVRHGGRALDRHTPRLIDSRRCNKPPNHPSSNHSHLPSSSKPKLYNLLPSSHSTSSKPKLYLPSSSSSSSSSHEPPSSKPKSYLPSTSSSKTVKSHHSSSSSKSPSSKPKSYRPKARKSSAEQKDVSTPPGSSRYLLGDAAFFDVFSDFESVLPSSVVSAKLTGSESIKAEEFPVLSPLSPLSHEQVVVLRVSLHCKGCEGKVKKHLSRMEGVKSFNIDFPKKKVTVIGDVTPLGVLASISRVKNAQFWPTSPPSSTPSSIYRS